MNPVQSVMALMLLMVSAWMTLMARTFGQRVAWMLAFIFTAVIMAVASIGDNPAYP